MALKRLARHAKAVLEVPRDLLLGRYPPFVTGGALPRSHVPVFVFHSLEPEGFGEKLEYLALNGYRTLSASEYFHVLMGATTPPERAVVLTFDDGRESVHSVGLPLMKRHGFNGIVFLVPGRLAARHDHGAMPARGREDVDFLSWEQIEDLRASGLFDFESHTLSHSRVHTGPQVAGFMTPSQRRGLACLDTPLVWQGQRDLSPEEIPLGTPLLRSEPRTSECLRFFEDPAVREACVSRVAEEGGEGFFYRKGWERALRALLGKKSIKGRVETATEREVAIRKELQESKRIIEDRTGREVLHLCYPWHVSGPTARRLAREVGYRTAFAGKVPGTPITLPGGDPMAVARIGEDYVQLLPGRGRANLTRILRHKWSRRLGKEP